MGNKENHSVVVANRAITVFTKVLYGGIYPLLGDVSRSVHVDKRVAKVPDEACCRVISNLTGIESGTTDFQRLAYPGIPPARHPWSAHLQAMEPTVAVEIE